MNFIIKKTLRSLDIDENPNEQAKVEFFFSTYRVMWEGASIDLIKIELKISKNLSQLFLFIKKLLSFSWEKALEAKSKIEKLSIKEAIPTFFIERLLPVMTLKEIKLNIQYMNFYNENSFFTIRINDLTDSSRKENLLSLVIHDLSKKNILIRYDPHIPELIHIPVKQKSLVLKNKWYKEGYIIIQDKASAAVIHILTPRINEFLCDMCVAPGMKASLIAYYTKNKAVVVSGEFNTNRAKLTKELFKKLSVTSNHIINTDSIIFPIRSKHQFDRILLDAPCTGSGTFLASPELKWRQNENFLHQNIILQKKLIKSAINLLKPNGILVYSTCSLYPEEGEYQILDFLDYLKPLALPEWFSPSYKIKNSILPGTGRLFPSIHQTQGFFIGKFQKKEP